MERVFGTLQQRLPPELRRAGVRDQKDANAYLREIFVPAYEDRLGSLAHDRPLGQFAAGAPERLMLLR